MKNSRGSCGENALVLTATLRQLLSLIPDFPLDRSETVRHPSRRIFSLSKVSWKSFLSFFGFCTGATLEQESGNIFWIQKRSNSKQILSSIR